MSELSSLACRVSPIMDSRILQNSRLVSEPLEALGDIGLESRQGFTE